MWRYNFMFFDYIMNNIVVLYMLEKEIWKKLGDREIYQRNINKLNKYEFEKWWIFLYF